jgi:hypothetical protein
VETLLKIGVEVLRLVPLILALYIPALLGVVIWKEGYRVKAILTFALGFGVIIGLQLLFTSASALQVALTMALSLVQVAVALLLAALTVYRLAD